MTVLFRKKCYFSAFGGVIHCMVTTPSSFIFIDRCTVGVAFRKNQLYNYFSADRFLVKVNISYHLERN